ncbi:hypothetical protein FAI41_00855 [Acetobacteraceae bacterium]|nr:hypothetical protein FAI41_00855 [Acetobacteraceae bacterium]
MLLKYFSAHSSLKKLGLSALALSCSLSLTGCMVSDQEKDPGSAHNAYFKSPEFLALINDSVGKENGVPAGVIRVNKLGSVSLTRLSEIGINFGKNSSELMSRYAELEFQGDAHQGGVLTEVEAGVGHGPIIYWVPDSEILAHLSKEDEASRQASEGKEKAHPRFGDPFLSTCVARVTAQGFEEEYPFEAWHYCADPSTPKDLTPRVNGFLRKLGIK